MLGCFIVISNDVTNSISEQQYTESKMWSNGTNKCTKIQSCELNYIAKLRFLMMMML